MYVLPNTHTIPLPTYLHLHIFISFIFIYTYTVEEYSTYNTTLCQLPVVSELPGPRYLIGRASAGERSFSLGHL